MTDKELELRFMWAAATAGQSAFIAALGCAIGSYAFQLQHEEAQAAFNKIRAEIQSRRMQVEIDIYNLSQNE